jgi:hypothetical protein
MEIIDAIFVYNRDRWGGRYNPIVLTDGRTLSDVWWSFLEAVDPDIVTSFVRLSDGLVAGSERRVSPYLIQQPDPRDEEGMRRHIHLYDNPLSILPTPRNVRMASWALGEPNLVLFETEWQRTEPLIKRFIEWNFGGYSLPIEAVTRALEGVRILRYPVADAASLVAPLTELTAFRPFTYPIQLCSLPKEALPPVDHDRFEQAFHVVIGNTPADVAYFWNRPATTPQWSRTYLNQVWLPTDVATNASLTTALSSWFQRCADPGGSQQGSIRFVSLGLPQERLQELSSRSHANCGSSFGMWTLSPRYSRQRLAREFLDRGVSTRWICTGQLVRPSDSRSKSRKSSEAPISTSTGWRTCTSSSGPSGIRRSADARSGGNFLG